jgi:hypothetical protein
MSGVKKECARSPRVLSFKATGEGRDGLHPIANGAESGRSSFEIVLRDGTDLFHEC